MPILSSTSDVKAHVSLAANFEFEDFKPYINKAIVKFTYRYVGNLHITLADEQVDPVLAEARTRLQNAICNFGLFIYLPLGSVVLDGSGLSNYVNDNRTPLDWRKEKDIMRELLSSGHEAMDQLLAYMEENKDSFEIWATSPAYTESKKFLVSDTTTFNNYYHIFDSRQTYIALQPAMRQVEDKYIYSLICREVVDHLKSDAFEGVKGQVKEYLQKAVVAFTIAKVCNEGLFIIDATGLKLRFDALPYDKVEAVDTDLLKSTVDGQTAAGRNYLKMVEAVILNNLSEFNQCAVPIIVGQTGGYTPYNTQSVLSI
ncbi:MAG: hypothetical protein EOO20_03300 [Chryseobacterium sp.]|nr:MAG: hypothetical protein EOO20_03300 [Chryseobacterium sp.]